MDSLFSRQRRLLDNVSLDIVRDIMHDIDWNKRLISIRGNRGVGKTTLMLQYIKQNYPSDTTEALYCTLDSLYFTSHTLVDLAEQFVMMGGKQLLFDEVHKYKNWSREIKEIYDVFPTLKVAISGSSLLQILNADADLSRRCRPYEMSGLSFREYLRFYKGFDFQRHSLEEILSNADTICSEVVAKIPPIAYFRDYLKHGYYPFFDGNTEDYEIAIENIINLVVDQEMPLICGTDPSYSRKIKAFLHILATTVPFNVDITKLGTMLELNRNTITSYLNHLHAAGLVETLYSDINSVKRMQKPDKVYIHDTNMLATLAQVNVPNIGTIRETFAVSQLITKHKVEYGMKAGDFVVDGKYTFEIGGKDKSFMQIADMQDSYIFADDIEHPVGKKLPLWLLGFIY